MVPSVFSDLRVYREASLWRKPHDSYSNPIRAKSDNTLVGVCGTNNKVGCLLYDIVCRFNVRAKQY